MDSESVAVESLRRVAVLAHCVHLDRAAEKGTEALRLLAMRGSEIEGIA